jgi:hypothetical protein
MDPKKALILYATKTEKEFEREAERFRKFHKIPKVNMVPIDCSKPLWRRRNQVVIEFNRRQDLETVAIFCHGWPRRIQFGFNLENIQLLVNVIRNRTLPDANIVLYCCSCARRPGLDPKKQIYFPAFRITEGSFAEQLVFESGGGRVVWGHYNSGHTTKNPYILRTYGYGFTDWAEIPHSIYWAKWARKMRTTNFRFKFFEEVI